MDVGTAEMAAEIVDAVDVAAAAVVDVDVAAAYVLLVVVDDGGDAAVAVAVPRPLLASLVADVVQEMIWQLRYYCDCYYYCCRLCQTF